MKNLLFVKITLLFFILLVASHSYSQKLYFNVGLGYNYSAASTYSVTDNIEIYSDNGNSYVLSGVNNTLKETISFGKGFQFGGVVGYNFSEHFSFELAVSYLNGREYEEIFTQRYANNSDAYSRIYKSQMLRLMPSVKLSVGDALKPYLKTGLVIGVGSKINVQETFNFKDQYFNAIYQLSEFDLSGGISIGFVTGIGIRIESDDKWGFFSEINIITQSWAPEKASYSKFIQNGSDFLSRLPYNMKENVFVDSYSSSVDNSNTETSSEKLKQYFPFSSIGFNIGIYYQL
ncbi:MAG: outer membrane beta-barrel protein [Bacteroidales bacterium]